MITLDVLNKFLSESNERFEFPFALDDKVCFANGYICLRVDRDQIDTGGVILEMSNGPRPESVLKLFGELPAEVTWTKIDSLELSAPERCLECNGAGKDFKCYECGGDGSIDFDNDHNSYEVDCKSCGGNGRIAICRYCSGTGKYYEGQTPIGMAIFQTHFLHMLKELGECEIAPTGEHAPARIRFAGGDGLVMPMVMHQAAVKNAA